MATARIPSEAETRAAVTGIIDALSEWREEVADSTKRYNTAVLDKIAEAADAVGWPKDVLEATESSLQQAADMQLKVIDQMTETWRAQLRSPASVGFGGMPAFASMGTGAFNPFELWMQTATAWQRSFADTWSAWADASKH